jgi:hypothetical protein
MANKATKQKRLEEAIEIFDILIARDYEVTQFSQYHFRVNGRLDIWPTSKKWYDTRSHAKGTYIDLIETVDSVVK